MNREGSKGKGELEKEDECIHSMYIVQWGGSSRWGYSIEQDPLFLKEGGTKDYNAGEFG